MYSLGITDNWNDGHDGHDVMIDDWKDGHDVFERPRFFQASQDYAYRS